MNTFFPGVLNETEIGINFILFYLFFQKCNDLTEFVKETIAERFYPRTVAEPMKSFGCYSYHTIIDGVGCKGGQNFIETLDILFKSSGSSKYSILHASFSFINSYKIFFDGIKRNTHFEKVSVVCLNVGKNSCS